MSSDDWISSDKLREKCSDMIHDGNMDDAIISRINDGFYDDEVWDRFSTGVFDKDLKENGWIQLDDDDYDILIQLTDNLSHILATLGLVEPKSLIKLIKRLEGTI